MWRRPILNARTKEYSFPENAKPLLDAAAFAAALERYVAHPQTAETNGTTANVNDGSCFDVDARAMVPYVAAVDNDTRPNFKYVEPTYGAAVAGVDIRPRADLAALAALRPRPWTRWSDACDAPQVPLDESHR